jgi:putative ABC transport system permease protein
MKIWKMSWRNVLRNRRRTAITVGAMAFALMIELLYAGIIPGMIEGMEDDVVDLEMGDMQIFGGDWLERPSMYELIEKDGELLKKLDGIGYPAAPRLSGGGMLAAEDNSAGVAFRAVDVERDAKVSLIGQKVEQGRWLDPADPKGVVLGKRLARTLGVKLGDELVVLAQATDGSMANALFTVRGTLYSVAGGADRTTVYVNVSAFRELFIIPDGAHQIIVRRPPDVALEKAAEQVSAILAGHSAGKVEMKTWKELMPVIATMLESSKGVVGVVFFVFYIAVGILVLNAMLMAVFERIREFGVLKAIGTPPSTVFALIMAETFLQALLAAILGIIIALPGMWYLSTYGIDMGAVGGTDLMGVTMRPMMMGIYRPDVVTTPIVMLFFVVILSSLYPALKAAFIGPLEAMHHQ